MKRERIDPPYKAYLVAPDGTKTPVVAHGIVIELGPNLELELDLAPHPNHAGGLPIRAGPERTLAELENSGFSSSLVVRPGASNVIHVLVERHPWQIIFGDEANEISEPIPAADGGRDRTDGGTRNGRTTNLSCRNT
jgi:hypothetical protein